MIAVNSFAPTAGLTPTPASFDTTASDQQALRDCVYGRTFDGHREALRISSTLSPSERRLLLLVTGLTPLSVLTPQTSGIDDPVATASKLLQAGLIEPVEPDVISVYTPPERKSKWS
jgi:hypothetical protein